MKRIFDFSLALIGLISTSFILLPVIFLIWIQDWHSPFYIAPRVGKGQKVFKMLKLRSMVVNADKTGVDSTSSNDKRITAVGRFIRKYKLDELSQLWNVLIGDMSLVGPRPNVKRETDLYTLVEKRLLTVRPGITDLSSIVFSDEGDILKDQVDPDIAYNQLIRPRKSLLGIFYIEKRNFLMDLKLVYLTILSIISKEKALNSLGLILKKSEGSPLLIEIASRKNNLVPMPPPGAINIVTNRDGRVEE